MITKTDFLWAGSENEASWLELAQNKAIHFELGWHLMKNRGEQEGQLSFGERNLKEQLFFSRGKYQALLQHMKGVDSLRQRLSKLLFDHLKRELPQLKAELDEMVESTEADLETLGTHRGTLSEQRVYLTEIFTKAWDLIRMGANGNYENAIFREVDLSSSVDQDDNALRLRAVVQYLNCQFEERIRLRGHRYEVLPHSVTVIDDPNAETTTVSRRNHAPQKIGRSAAIGRVTKIMQWTRGRELAGTFNPMLISQLFANQSKFWDGIAHDHIDAVANICQNFVLHVLTTVASSDVKRKIVAITVVPALKTAYEAAKSELNLIIEDKKRHPMTYNHYFTDTIQNNRKERYIRMMTDAASRATVSIPEKTTPQGGGFEMRKYVSPSMLSSEANRIIERDMERYSAEQALDAHEAYYKVSLYATSGWLPTYFRSRMSRNTSSVWSLSR